VFVYLLDQKAQRQFSLTIERLIADYIEAMGRAGSL
jgi:hypothetical protein